MEYHSLFLTPNKPLQFFDDSILEKKGNLGLPFGDPNEASSAFNFTQVPNNGNMISDGTNSYSWDAEDRLLQITYPGTDNNTQLLYDPLGRCVKITETTAGSVTSTKQFVWCGNERCEERDGSGSLSNGKQFYGLGQVNYTSGTPTNYFYNLDHLGSVREMTKTVSGTTTIEAQYAYGAWGEVSKLAGSADSDFQYAGYYKHARSGLGLTLYRAYSEGLGRWLSRDPLGESAGVNLYGYVGGNPMGFVDPLGLQNAPAEIMMQMTSGMRAQPETVQI